MNDLQELLNRSNDIQPIDTEMSELLVLIRDMLVNAAPNKFRRSGGALRNSIRIENDKVIVGNDVAFYAVYTNEKWISPRWHGKQNPNENWINDIVSQALIIFSGKYGYKVVYE